MYQVYVKCDHVSPADVKMSRANEIEILSEQMRDGLMEIADEPAGFIHICDSCKAVLGARFHDAVVM